MKDIKPNLHFWWVFTLCGVCFTGLGSYVSTNQPLTYDELSLAFAAIIIFSGIVELAFCIINHTWFSGWGWYVGGAVIDIILGLIFGTNPLLAAISLPLFAGIWLLVRSAVILGCSFQIRKNQFSECP